VMNQVWKTKIPQTLKIVNIRMIIKFQKLLRLHHVYRIHKTQNREGENFGCMKIFELLITKIENFNVDFMLTMQDEGRFEKFQCC
jgi:hypothetical protein